MPASSETVRSGSEGRHLPLHILFVHSHVAEEERCLQELNEMHFTVSAEIVGTPEEFSERLGSHAYDLVVAEYPSPDWRETQTLELLHLSNSLIPLIFVGGILQRQTVAEFITSSAYDCIEMGRIGHWGTVREQQAPNTVENCGARHKKELDDSTTQSSGTIGRIPLRKRKSTLELYLCTPRVPQSGVFAVFLPFAVSYNQ